MNKAKVYIPNGWATDADGLVPLARSLLRRPSSSHMGTYRDRFLHEMDFSDSCVRATTPEESDFLLLPTPWTEELPKKYAGECRLLEQLSRRCDKPIVCHAMTKDIVHPREAIVPFSRPCYLNRCLLRCCKPEYALGFPYFIPDCRQKYVPSPQILDKPREPTVGFCGIAAPHGTPWNRTRLFDHVRVLLTSLGRIGLDPEALARNIAFTNLKHAYRTRLILQFRADPQINSDFILRRTAGLVDNSFTNLPDNHDYNSSFYDNMARNVYNLCCRGTENYSVRFYETLCMGRIPVVVDTDLVLPFDDQIDYQQHCVWIHKHELHRAAEILKDFHRSKSNAEIRHMQVSNRRVWETWLCHRSYYPRLAELLRNANNGMYTDAA
jgi:hypothetical protein